jgi:hypothetical protein
MAFDISTARTQLAQLYVATFNRAPDGAGLAYWVGRMQNGSTITSIANEFFNYPETQAIYGARTNSELVSAVYQNILGRAVESTDVLNYWSSRLDSGAIAKGAFIQAIINAATTNGSADGVMLNNKAAVGVQFAISGMSNAYASSIIAGVTSVTATKDAALVTISDAVNTQTLTSGNDNLVGTKFEAPQTYTPGGTDRINSLQDNDTLTGIGTADKLTVTIGVNADTADNVITPRMTGVETVNVSFDASSYYLDMQDSTGTTAVNISRMNAGATNGVINMTSVPTNLAVTSSSARATEADFTFNDAATTGTTDATTLALNSANIGTIVLQSSTGATGVETINVQSNVSANNVGLLTAQDVRTLNISGSQNLTMGARGTTTNAATTVVEATRYTAALSNVAGSLTSIDASTLTGKLDIVLGTELNAIADNSTGTPVALSVKGGTGDDTFVLAQGASIDAVTGNIDTIDGGTGANKLILLGGAAQAVAAHASGANLKNIQALEIRAGQDGDAVADVVTVNADAFDSLASIYVRDEGQTVAAGVASSAAEVMTVNLNNLTVAQANAITLAHGTTGNSTITNNILNIALKTATGIADAAQITIVDNVNADPVFNAQITATAIERVTIVDSDTESNTIHLTSGINAATTAANRVGSSLTLKGGVAGQYMNLDSTPGLAGIGAAVGTVGYGYATTGVAGSATTATAAAAAIAGVPTTVSTSARDNTVASVFNGNTNVELNKVWTETIDASTYVGDVIVRLGDITRVDGVTSQNITTSTGNDTFIFDALQSTSAGFTSGDTIAAGTGTDTLILDGDTSALPGTPVINHAKSEWDNLTGIDVLRFGTNPAGYVAEIDNDFVQQTDAHNRLTIINNDGRLDTDAESSVTINARLLDQTHFITFVGANQVGTKTGVNTIQLSDVSANGSMILNGGDTDVRVSTTAGYVAGNNNVYDVWNTANVSVNDLAQVKNFGTVQFHNDQAVAQTLSLTLNNTVVEAMVDESNTATSAATQERLVITAVDGAAAASSLLNVNASAVTGFHGINVTGSATGNDIVSLDANVGGTASIINLGGGTGDRINWTGGSATMTVLDDLNTTTTTFTVGATSTTHTTTGYEIVDYSALTYASATITGTGAAETIIGGAGANTVTGGNGGDKVTFAAHTIGTVDTITYTAAGQTLSGSVTSGVTALTLAAGADVVYGMQAGDKINLSTIAATYTGALTTTINGASGNTADIVRGDYNTSTGVFTVSVTGADSLVQFDNDAAGAGTTIDNIVLVGFVNTSSSAASGIITLA